MTDVGDSPEAKADFDQRLQSAIDRVPFLRNAGEPVRLGGLTNVNVRFGDFVLRIPGVGTGEYIDRGLEHVAANRAAATGVNVPVLFFDPDDGLMVTKFLHGATTMSPHAFVDTGAIARAGQAFRRLHTTTQPFASNFSLFAMIDDYKSLLASKNATLPDGYSQAQSTADSARRALMANPVAFVPSHCDPLCENFLDTGAQMFIIDYEYAANNDPMWDLGDLSVEGGFTAAQDQVLLHAYFDGDVPAVDQARMVLYKALCDLLWTLWGVIQHVNNNPADDFWAYATGRFDRCTTLMATTEFTASIDLLVSLTVPAAHGDNGGGHEERASR